DNAELRTDLVLVDAAWGKSTLTVYKFCRENKHGAAVVAAIGRGITAAMAPFDQYVRKEGETIGDHWMMPSTKGKQTSRHVIVDTNHYKSFVQARLRVAMGDKSCLSLFGRDPGEHRMLADHVTSEYGTKTTGRGRELVEWR